MPPMKCLYLLNIIFTLEIVAIKYLCKLPNCKHSNVGAIFCATIGKDIQG